MYDEIFQWNVEHSIEILVLIIRKVKNKYTQDKQKQNWTFCIYCHVHLHFLFIALRTPCHVSIWDGGRGKSEVIKAFVCFAGDWIKITALTGAAACEILYERTLHCEACLSSRKIGQNQKDTWVYTKMLIIYEVSFLDEDNIRKLDKNMRKLKERNVIYGGVHVFVGDFFQIFPVRGLPLFKKKHLTI